MNIDKCLLFFLSILVGLNARSQQKNLAEKLGFFKGREASDCTCG
jgi:hypothetical protein